MIGQAKIDFGTVTASVVGGDLTLGRGTRPGVFRLRVLATGNIACQSASLTLTQDSLSWKFDGCVPDLSTLRMHVARTDITEFSLLCYDRRAKWIGKRYNGQHNLRYRDNTIIESTKIPAYEIFDALLEAAGESGSDTQDFTGKDAYPRLDADDAALTSCIDDMLGALAVHLCPSGPAAFTLYSTGAGSGMPISQNNATPDVAATIQHGPKTVVVSCAPTWFQCYLELEAVGLDTDGSWKPIDALSYKPTDGWASQWPTLFSGVVAANRDLALTTVWRCYRVKTGQDLPVTDEEFSSLNQIELSELLVEMAGSGDSKREQPSYVVGTFWPEGDHPYNTRECLRWPGQFSIDKSERIVWFEHPVVKFGSSECVEAATLYLCCGFRFRKPSTLQYVRKTFDYTRDTGDGEQVLRHDELWETRIQQYSYCSATGDVKTNVDTVEDEADIYGNAWKDYWDKSQAKREIEFVGLVEAWPSGNIGQVSARFGQHRHQVTRISEHFESMPLP